MDICVGHAFLLSDGVNWFSAIETQRFVTFCWEVWSSCYVSSWNVHMKSYKSKVAIKSLCFICVGYRHMWVYC